MYLPLSLQGFKTLYGMPAVSEEDIWKRRLFAYRPSHISPITLKPHNSSLQQLPRKYCKDDNLIAQYKETEHMGN